MKIKAKGTEISVISNSNGIGEDYISLTDLARQKNPYEPKDVVKNWLRIRSTLDFIGLWESLYNPLFKGVEFDSFKNESGTNSFTLTPKRWIEKTNAIGIISKAGKGGGTYAHSDIALEFASWISPEFKLYVIKDYKRLKLEEAKQSTLGWNMRRELSKINYHIHTDAIKKFLITPELTKQEINYKYATEADVLNVALFGKTAKQWRDETGNKKETMRDFASVEQLIVLVNLESMNADMIRENIPMDKRIQKLRKMAYYQLESLSKNNLASRLAENTTTALIQ